MNNITLLNNFFIRTTLKVILISTLLASIFPSCKSKRKITASNIDTTAAHIERENVRTLKENLKRNEFKFDWLSAKINVESTIDSSKNSFDVHLRCKKDSAIWLSITPLLGIEAARAIITKDSVKFVDRFHKEFFTGDFNYISKLLHADLDYEMIQSLLVGNSVSFYEEDEKLKSGIYDGKFLLSTVPKRKFVRVIEQNKELKDPVQGIWLDPSNYKIVRILFNEFNPDREFDASFSKFELVESLLFPHSISYTIKAEKKVFIQLDYSKVTVNKSQTLPFSIPEKYERIIYKGK